MNPEDPVDLREDQARPFDEEAEGGDGDGPCDGGCPFCGAFPPDLAEEVCSHCLTSIITGQDKETVEFPILVCDGVCDPKLLKSLESLEKAINRFLKSHLGKTLGRVSRRLRGLVRVIERSIKMDEDEREEAAGEAFEKYIRAVFGDTGDDVRETEAGGFDSSPYRVLWSPTAEETARKVNQLLAEDVRRLKAASVRRSVSE